MSQSVLLIPVASALGYAIAALMIKRAGEYGAGPWRVGFITNWVLAIVYSALWLFPGNQPGSFSNVLHAAIAGFAFFVGQIFTFLALSRGDVSVATPVLGSKVIFVALITLVLGVGTVTPAMWGAVILTALATALLSGGGHASRAAIFRSLAYGFSAALAFASTDVLQQRWVPLWGFAPFYATLFLTVAICSLTFIPFFSAPLRELNASSWRWALAGGSTLAVQAGAMAWSIITIGATTANVLYNSRGLWSVVLVWTIGHWFGNAERSHGRAVMMRRLAASLLILAAIFLIVRK